MSIEGSKERKKIVCTTLTGVVKASTLAGTIDPSALFMQLMGNYGVLVRGSTLDLVFLHELLTRTHPSQPMHMLFEELGEAGRNLGFEVKMPELEPTEGGPPRPRAGTPPQSVMRSHRGLTPIHGLPAISPPVSSSGMPAPTGGPRTPSGTFPMPSGGLPVPKGGMPAPTGGMPAPTGGMPAPTGGMPAARGLMPTPSSSGMPAPTPPPTSDAAPLQLSTLTPQRVTANLVNAMRTTESGPLISAPQLTYFLVSRMDELFRGVQFNFLPVYDALLEIQGVDEKSVYVGAVRFRRWLGREGGVLIEPEWKLDEESRKQLEEFAHKAAEQPHGGSHAPTPPPADEPAKDAAAPGETRADALRRKYGLRAGIGVGKGPLIRIGIGIAAVLVVAVLRVVLAPMSSVDKEAYAAVFPTKDTFIYEGKWMAIVDEERWNKMTVEQREKSLKDLTRVLTTENRLVGARILHPRDRTIMGFDVKGFGMMIAPSLLNTTFTSAPTAKKKR